MKYYEKCLQKHVSANWNENEDNPLHSDVHNDRWMTLNV